jgi:hypothetical protein
VSDRAYIKYQERNAAALACLLPEDMRKRLREEKVAASVVESFFELHHVVHHTAGGPALWWNLDPQLIAAHRERTAKIDIPAIAKIKRLSAEHEEHRRRMLAPTPERKEQKRLRWTKGRKLRSRGFERRRT